MATVRAILETLSSTRVEYVPPGLTGVSQSMDVAVMKSFKNQCSNLYVQKIAQGYELSTASNKRKLTAAVVVEAWKRISSDTIRNSFLRAGVVSVGLATSLADLKLIHHTTPTLL